LKQTTESSPKALAADFDALYDELKQIAARAKLIDFRKENGALRIKEPTILVRGK